MATQGPPVPSRDPITDRDGIVTWRWLRWFLGLRDQADLATQRPTPSVALTGQNDAIGTTAIPAPSLSAGLYRVSAITRVTTADGVSSSVTVTIHWTRDSTTLSKALSANTGDAVTSVVSEDVPLIRIDGATPVSYSTAYASNTANKMVYELDVTLEQIEA